MENDSSNVGNRRDSRQESNKRNDLDNRYGKIGISAVAAAVCHKGDQRTVTEPRFKPYDRD